MYLRQCLVLLTTIWTAVHSLHLRGVAIVSPPFVTKTTYGEYEGYAVDLMNELSRVVPFKYTLALIPGTWPASLHNAFLVNVKTLFGGRGRPRADFAIGYFTKSRDVEPYMDFSEPYMTGHLTALIHKRYIGNMTSFADMVNNTDVTYGGVREGDTLELMGGSRDPTIQSMVQHMNRNSLVNSEEEGVDRALNTNYAFIENSVSNEYQTDLICELTVIHDKQEYNRREYAIALQKGSPYKIDIDRAIRQLKNDGTVDRLKRKYWRAKCLKDSDVMSVAVKLGAISSLCLILSALISCVHININ